MKLILKFRQNIPTQIKNYIRRYTSDPRKINLFYQLLKYLNLSYFQDVFEFQNSVDLDNFEKNTLKTSH